MDDTNRELLNEAIRKRLKTANEFPNSDDGKVSFKEAMDAVDRQIELAKIDAAREENVRDEQTKKETAKKDRIIRCVEIGSALLIAPIIELTCKNIFAKRICNFEKDYTFTTSAGKSLSSIFRFKK